MEKQNINFEGNYSYSDEHMKNEKLELLIRKRKNPKGQKTTKFILFKTENANYNYLSSLYPNSENSYFLDNSRSRYKLNIFSANATIQKI